MSGPLACTAFRRLCSLAGFYTVLIYHSRLALPGSVAALPVSATSGFSSLLSPALPPFVCSLTRAVCTIGNY